MIDYKEFATMALALLKKLPESGYMMNVGTIGETNRLIESWDAAHKIDEYPLPEWAEDYNRNFDLVLRAQLCTKDGRRTGNARVVEIIDDHPLFPKDRIYKVRTDVGTELNIVKSEVHEMFHVGMYIMKEGQ